MNAYKHLYVYAQSIYAHFTYIHARPTWVGHTTVTHHTYHIAFVCLQTTLKVLQSVVEKGGSFDKEFKKNLMQIPEMEPCKPHVSTSWFHFGSVRCCT